MTWILLHVLAFHPLERLWWSLAWISSLTMGLSQSYFFLVTTDCDEVWHGYHRYLWDFLYHICSGDNWCGGWQLMWPFRFVAVPVCGRFGLWPFRFVAVPVCGRSGLWPFRFVAVSVCGRSSLWPFRFVAVSVVAVSVCCRYDLSPIYIYICVCVCVCVCSSTSAPQTVSIDPTLHKEYRSEQVSGTMIHRNNIPEDGCDDKVAYKWNIWEYTCQRYLSGIIYGRVTLLPNAVVWNGL